MRRRPFGALTPFATVNTDDELTAFQNVLLEELQ